MVHNQESKPSKRVRRPFPRLIGAVAAVVVAAVLVAAILYGERLSAGLSTFDHVGPVERAQIVGTVQGPDGAMPHAEISLSVYPNSLAGEHGKGGGGHPSWVSYSATNLWVPAHAVVTFTIRQYDTPTPTIDPFFDRVVGTRGGVAHYNGKAATELSSQQVAHTFTIHGIPQSTQPTVFVSVPLLGVPSNAPTGANGYPSPAVVRFSIVTGASGSYVFQCFVPCGTGFNGWGGPMESQGYMAGNVVVGRG